MDFTTAYILAGIGTALVFVWVILFLVYSKKFDEVIGAIDKKKYMLGEIYFIGFGIISLLKINMKSEKGRKKTHEISEIYGEKYADFYYYVVMGGSITYLVTLMPAAFLLGALANDLKICVMALAAAAVMYFYLDGEIKKSVNEKREEILADFPQMLSKITLLINAGMIIHDAWQKVAYTNDRPLYKEMQKACAEMGNGVSDRDAINNFAQRCSLKEIRKFA